MSEERGSGWACRWFQDGDEEQILELLSLCFGEWPRVDISVSPLDHLRWKMSSSAIARASGSVAETEDGRIIAVQLLFAQHVFVEGKRRHLIQGVDQCVHPDLQGRGVIRDLRRFAWPTFTRVFDMRIGITGQPALDVLRRREGSLPIGNTIGVLSADVSGSRRGATTPSAHGIRAGDDRFASLAAEASQSFDFMVCRDSEYLQWRYKRHGGDFTIREISEGGDMAGYAVTRLSSGRGHIVDLLALPGRLDIVDDVVREAMLDFGSAGVERAECWLPACHPYRSVLERHGYRLKRPLPMTYGSFQDVNVSFMSAPDARIHFMAGDLDLV
jgi:hypothetical protein